MFFKVSKYLVALTIMVTATTTSFAAEKPVDTEPKIILEQGGRYDHNYKNGVLNNKIKYTTIVGFEQQLSKDAYFILSGRNETTFKEHKRTSETEFDSSYLSINYGKANLTLGRMDYKPAFGLMVNSEFNGVRASYKFNKDFSMTAWTGRDRYEAEANKFNGVTYVLSNDVGGKENGNNRVTGIETSINLASKYNFRAAAMKSKIDDKNLEANYYEYGLQYSFDKKLSLLLQYGGSDADQFNKAKAVMLNYGKADMSKPGSFRVMTGFHSIEKFSALDCAYFKSTGFDEYQIRVDYVVAKNKRITFDYANGTATNDKNSKFNGYHADYKVVF